MTRGGEYRPERNEMANQPNGHKPSVHIILQAKGGVGKSYVAAIVAQYYRGRQFPVRCFDTDPGNATLAQYKALDVEHVGDLIQGGVINQKRFDPLIEKLLNGDGVAIVDTGASTFLPFWNYVLENEVLTLLETQDRQVYMHCVVTGGQAMKDTLNGLDRLAQTTSRKSIIVWLTNSSAKCEKALGPLSNSNWCRTWRPSWSVRCSFASEIRTPSKTTYSRCCEPG